MGNMQREKRAGRRKGGWLVQKEGAKHYRCDRCARSFQEAFIFFRTSPGKRCSAQTRIKRHELRDPGEMANEGMSIEADLQI